MPSPFPGIDPYLESQGRWPDFHARFIPTLCDAINDLLPESYRGADRRADDDGRALTGGGQADSPRRNRGAAGAGAIIHDIGVVWVALILEPVTIRMTFLEEDREIFLEILHLPDQKLVAVLELLSPSNKAGTGRRDYLVKRNGLRTSDVHLIEPDFLVGGRRLPMEQPLPPGDYFGQIARAECRPDCNVFAWTVRDPLPTIPIPLLAPDPDVLVDLAPLFATVYQRGRYAQLIRGFSEYR